MRIYQSCENQVLLKAQRKSSLLLAYIEIFRFFFTNPHFVLLILNQIKSLLLSHHHSTSALVSEILMSVLQTVQKNNRQFTYGQTVQKNNRQFTYGQTVQKSNSNLHMDSTYLQTVQKTMCKIHIHILSTHSVL